MEVLVNNDGDVIIDGGKLVISPIPFGGYFLGYGPGVEGSVDDEPQQEYDPYYYQNGNNDLTVEESAERALNHIYNDIWWYFVTTAIGDVNWLREAIRDMIRDGKGRNAVYKLAGGIKKGRMEQGLYAGVPLAYIFKGFVDGYIPPREEEGSENKYVLR